MKKIVYLDNASTTPITQPVLEAMIPYLTEYYGNPSSLYSLGTKSKTAIENARKQIAKAINCPEEYIHQSIRLSWDDTLTDEEIEYTIESVKKNIKKVRGYI